MRIIAVTNIKGGVGKTTTAVNLAHVASRAGLRTALWDLDSQGASTWLLRVKPEAGASAKRLVRGEQDLDVLLEPTAYPGLEVLPADASFRDFDRYLYERKRPAERLLKLSRVLRERFDLLLLDCPPGMSLLSEAVLRAADAVVVPVIPTPLAARMLEELQDCIHRLGWDIALLPFFSMVDRRRALHVDLINALRSVQPSMLATELPYSSEIERMTVRRAPLSAYAPRSVAASLYGALFAEIQAGLQAPTARSQ